MPRIPEIRNTHLYVPDPTMRPPLGDPPCATCGFPRPSRVHDVPATPPEATEIDARRLGESTEGDTP